MPKLPGSDLEVSKHPLRRINKRGSLRATGAFASRKMRQTIPWESSIELAFLQLAELDSDVTEIYAQSFLITGDGPEGPRRHYPDFVVVRGDKVEVHEIKPNAKASKPDVIGRTVWAARYCSDRGASYGLALESDLKAEPVFTHAQAILRRLHDRLDETVAAGTVERVERARVVTVGALTGWLERWNGTMESVITLVAHNRLAMDLRLPLGPQSPVWSIEAFPHRPRALPFSVEAGAV